MILHAKGIYAVFATFVQPALGSYEAELLSRLEKPCP